MKTQSIVVQKFGGTSVGTIERIEALAARIQTSVAKGLKPVVVVSAMSGETNRLVALAGQIDPNYRGISYDMIVASGEQVSVGLLGIALEKRGVQPRLFLGFQLGIRTDSVASRARIEDIRVERLHKALADGCVPVVAGFQGLDSSDQITTLGRGGSDTTAVALAAALELDSCEIYTDVPAVYTSDPRVVPKARPLKSLSFEETLEMASLGAKVLHIRSVEIAAKYGVKIVLKSTFEDAAGTIIGIEELDMEKPVVSSVTFERNVSVFRLYPLKKGIQPLSQIFEGLAKRGIVVDIVNQTTLPEGQRLAFSVSSDDCEEARQIIKKIVPETTNMEVLNPKSKISVVGVGMRNHTGVVETFLKCLESCEAEPHLITTSEIKISAVVESELLEPAARELHSKFGLDLDS
ncbi:MAG: aspartate kinase [Bdellovibrionales bacterium CG10_big_fil_rev_8_21_14_0_10_45_34]|nr:MAG: aspartate kinase [Bdellovibrionales bacterium CG10_big_fil_rev_8_21_14_0_10_45_34]